MGDQETRLLNDIIGKTDTDLILFFVILLIALVAFFIPLYTIISRDRKERRQAEHQRADADRQASNERQDKYIQREAQIIAVVTANTEVMASLKATLEATGASTNNSLIRIHERIDDQGKVMGILSTEITRVNTVLDRVISNQSAMLEGINKTLVIVDNAYTGGSV